MAENLTNPQYYLLPDGKQSIDVLKEELTPDEFIGFLKGNAIKYSLRHGNKLHITEEMATEFLSLLPPGNVALLKDDVILHFDTWVKAINEKMFDTDHKKRDWYEDRLHRIGMYVGDVIVKLLKKYRA